MSFSITTVEPLTFDRPRADAMVADVGHPDDPLWIRIVSRDATGLHARAIALEGKRVRITVAVVEDVPAPAVPTESAPDQKP